MYVQVGASLGSDHEGGGAGVAREKVHGSLTRLQDTGGDQDSVSGIDDRFFHQGIGGYATGVSTLHEVPSPKSTFLAPQISPSTITPGKQGHDTSISSNQQAYSLPSPRRLLSQKDGEIYVPVDRQPISAVDTDIAAISQGIGAESGAFSNILTTETTGSEGSGSIDGKAGTGSFPYEAEEFEYDDRYVEYEEKYETEDPVNTGPAITRGNSNGEASSLGSSGGSANSGKKLLPRAKKTKPRKISVQSTGLKHKGKKNKSISDSDISNPKKDLTVGLLSKIRGNSDSKINHAPYENGRVHVGNCVGTLDDSYVPLSSLTSQAAGIAKTVDSSPIVATEIAEAPEANEITAVAPQGHLNADHHHWTVPAVVLDEADSDSEELEIKSEVANRDRSTNTIAAAAKAVFQTVSWENVPGPSGETTKGTIRHAVSDSGALSGTGGRGKGKAIVANGGSRNSSSSSSLYRTDRNGYYSRPYHHRSLENGGVQGGSEHSEKSSFWKELPQYQLSNYHQAHQQRQESNSSGHSTPVATTSAAVGGPHQHSRYHRFYQDAHRGGRSDVKIQDIVKNGIEIYPPGLDSRSATPRVVRDHSPIWVTRTSRPGAVADLERQLPSRPTGGGNSGFVPVRGSRTTLGDDDEDEEWAERVSLSDASEYHYQGGARHSPRLGPAVASNRAASGAVGRRGAGSGPPGKRKPGEADARGGRRGMMSRPGRRGCCKIIHLKEDNARFILLAIVMVLYMLSGAALFTALERDNEVSEKRVYVKLVESFKLKYPEVNASDLEYLLHMHSKAETAGYVGDRRPRWDFPGSFYFVGTVVSTIGFGMTTPHTVAGKVVLIFYGFFGCSGAILFFNLFLERIITFLAYILRAIHERGQRKKGLLGGGDRRRRSSQGSEDEQLDSWKPSVYWVMLILTLGALVVAVIASGMYHPVEEWTYWEAMYFCFVTFATIGFGDYVVSQRAEYPNVVLYRLGNFIFIVLGCCCIYSLFNVTSIVIKQVLNWMLRKLNCECRIRKPPMTRRNAITPGHLQRRSTVKNAAAGAGAAATGAGGKGGAPTVTVTEADGDSDSEYRRNSGEMISMKDFLQANKISLAMMQKQLWETSQRGSYSNSGRGFQGGVGPLAILNRKLGQDEFDPAM